MSSIALIGCGYWGKNWYNTIKNSSYTLKYVVERSTPKTNIDSNITLIKNIENLPDDFTHAIVSTQADSHVEIAKFLNEKRNIPLKNILVEKPCGVDHSEAIEIAGITPGYIFLFDPKFQYIKSCFNIIGDPFLFKTIRASMGPKIRKDVSVIEDYMYHDLYLYLDLFGAEILKITVNGYHRFLEHPISEATVNIISKKVVANMFSSWWYPQKERRTIIIGSKGSFVCEENKLKYYDSYYGKYPTYTLHTGQECEIIPTVCKSNLELELKAFMEDKLPFSRSVMTETWELVEKIKENI